MIPLFKVGMTPQAAVNVAQVLASGYVGQGPVVEQFEILLQKALYAPVRPLTTSSGTAALTLAYRLIGIGPGDEVISTPMTCSATNLPLLHLGATIIWADVDPMTGLLDPEDVQRKLTRKTKAVVAVDWGGQPADYRALRRVADGIPLVEDAAHAFGATLHGSAVAHSGGSWIAWSFQAIKHLTTGDGGALLVPADQYERAKRLRWFGLDRTANSDFRAGQDIPEPGDKFHLNDVAAAIGVANLPLALQHRLQHRAHAAWLQERFSLSRGAMIGGGSWWVYTLLSDQRDALQAHLTANGIASSQVHARNDRLTCFRQMPPQELPGVDTFSATQLAIPCGWWLTEADLQHIAAAVESFGRMPVGA